MEERTAGSRRWGLVALLASTAAVSVACLGPRTQILEPPLLVAHAGGVARSQTHSNSLEALNASVVKGFRLIELDFSWTRDGHLVLLHDWDRQFQELFNHPPGRLSLSEFRSGQSKYGLTHLGLQELSSWLDHNPQVSIVTDVKGRNIEGLRTIAETVGHHLPRFVPQIYRPDEYAPVRALGYEQIIFTLYRSLLDDDAVVVFSESHQLFAVTMSLRRSAASDLMIRLRGTGIPILVHTVNDLPTLGRMTEMGASGVYTDWLSPADVAEITRSNSQPD